jgi:hypothetical protein
LSIFEEENSQNFPFDFIYCLNLKLKIDKLWPSIWNIVYIKASK